MLNWCFLLLPMIWADAPRPFWLVKEKVYERIQNGEVIVSVTTKNNGENLNRMVVSGGGHVAAPQAFTWARAREFERMPEITSYIRKARFNSKNGILSLTISALSYSADMDLKLTLNEAAKPSTISYVVVRGPMKGFKGQFSFKELDSAKTEVGIDGHFIYDTFPIPRIFLEFGMEVVFQRIAASLRQHVEREFSKPVRP